MRFQYDHGMPADGIAGVQTKRALMDGSVPAEADRVSQPKPLALWSAQEILGGADLHNGRGKSTASYINGVPVISHQRMRDLGQGPKPHRGVDLPLAVGHPIFATGTQARVWYDAGGGGLVVEQAHPAMPDVWIQVLHAQEAFGRDWEQWKASGPGTFELQPNELGKRVIGRTGNTGASGGPHTHVGLRTTGDNAYGAARQPEAQRFLMVKSTLPGILHWGSRKEVHVAQGPPAYADHGKRVDIESTASIVEVPALKAAPKVSEPPVQVEEVPVVPGLFLPANVKAEVDFSVPHLVAEPPAAAEQSSGDYIPKGGKVRYNAAERVRKDPKGAAALVDVANHLGLEPVEFVALMSWESGGTLNPNALGGDGDVYKGLIQFSPGNAQKYGVTGQISIAEYAPAVMEYMQDRGFKPGEHDIRHAYASVLVGTADENYRHPKTGKLSWDLRDSNGTTVRNASPKFQQGAHYERAKAFLEASLGEIPAKPKPQAVIEPPSQHVAAVVPVAAAEDSAPKKVVPRLNGEELEEEVVPEIVEEIAPKTEEVPQKVISQEPPSTFSNVVKTLAAAAKSKSSEPK
jgi:murein DD-endopeptidase MepM/ murein hydrolase activator NlpD